MVWVFINTVVIKPDNKRIMRDGSMVLLKLLDPPYLRPCILLLRSEYGQKTKIKEIKEHQLSFENIMNILLHPTT